MKKFFPLLWSACCLATAVLFAAPIRSNLGGEGVEYGAVEPYTAASYVQEGLFLMYDGIENVGWGEHDSSATTMADLGPFGLDFSIGTSGIFYFEDDCLFVPKNYYTPRTINLPDDAYAELITALSNATVTIEYCWEDLGTDYPTGNGQGVRGPIALCGSGESIAGCRVDIFKATFWNSGYGYYWGPAIELGDIQKGGSYSAMVYGMETEYKIKEVVRYNGLYSIGTAPNNSSSSEGTWAQRVGTLYKTKKIVLFNSNNRQTGRLYNLRIYTRALSKEEMAHNWNVDRERFGIGL